MNDVRRTLCQTLGGLLAVLGLGACGQPAVQAPAKSVRSYTEEELRRMNKFRGINGAEWLLSGAESISYVSVWDENNQIVDSPAAVSPGSRSRFSINKIPIELRVTWRDQDLKNPVYSNNHRESWTGGKVTGTFVIPVADRIPDDLLDDLRRVPKGSLRIKVRLHREGVLLGWDIERRPGFNAQKSREGQHYPPAYSHTGGDFKESRLAYYIESRTSCRECIAVALSYRRNPSVIYKDDPNGFTTFPKGPEFGGSLPKVLVDQGYDLTPQYDAMSPSRLIEKGWYIHPKTGQRIETDF